ncbi:hypothetical protein E8E13_005651 [Curvularia kusanoi]|uniref:Peptidase A1 domain-containing protein n=1 Tax=Curvularia kusanoi TaxID=90978 RepID=A0A9P4WAP3_CURKU|nr:hypothetical protein E8E13_005651 [Curvularia kusanoi]
MLKLLLLALSPALLHAQQNQQIPLQDHQPSLVVPLTLNEDRTYTFGSSHHDINILSSEAISAFQSSQATTPSPQNAIISIPLDPTKPGSMTLGSHVQQETETEWTSTRTPGEDVAINYVGIRKEGMISMDAYATRLALDTPYIALPSEIYDVLVLATKPVSHQHSAGYDDEVDCGSMGRFPDLVLGLEPEIEEEEEDDEAVEIKEIVVTPEQYVLRTQEGKCVLLAQRAYQRGREEVVLGWAAVRGKHVVLDWANERTGFVL